MSRESAGESERSDPPEPIGAMRGQARSESQPCADAVAATGIDRRNFLRVTVTATTAAASGLGGGLITTAAAQQPGGRTQPQLPPLGNGEPPAFQFQAYPGGTGALIEKLAGERGWDSFARATFTIEPWSGPVPATEEELAFLPAHRLAALLRARHVSAVELTDLYLARLKRYDPTLLFAVTILDGPAREEAQQADAEIRRGEYRGPLHGLPYGLKDLFSTRGARTTWGSADFENRVIDEDAEIVTRLRNAGAVLVAKLATGEFARGDQWYRGRTNNPWNPEQGSSGSSAGPASATAAGCVAFGIGTETQGSIVSPARRCGLSALRPTFGRVSRHGGMVLAWSMDKVGPLCRTVEDCAMVFNEIHGADEKDPATITAPFHYDRDADIARFRIGYAADAPETFVAKLRELGANLVPMPERPGSQGISMLGAESAAAFDFHVASRLADAAGDSAGDAGRAAQGGRGNAANAGGRGAGQGGRGGPQGGRGGRFTNGRSIAALDFIQSQRRRHMLMVEMAELMEGFDMFVSGSGDVGLTNQTGHPAVVLPYDFGGEVPQPICTTIIGGLFADDAILAVAHAYQRATDWHTRRPRLA